MLLPHVSIAICFYNAEKFLEGGLNSLFSQTLENVEYILVDDGSTDSSWAILQAYLATHSVVGAEMKVIRNEQNQGVYFARNQCLETATGEYFICFDVDDWVDPDLYLKLYTKAKETNADIVGCDFYFERSNKRRYSKQPFSLSAECCLHVSLKDKLHNAFWNKLIRRSLYTDNGVRFFESKMWGDVATIPKLYFFAKRIAYVPDALYHHRIGHASLSRDKNKRAFIRSNMIDACCDLEDFLKEEKIYEKYKNDFGMLKLLAKRTFLFEGEEGVRLWEKIFPETNAMLYMDFRGGLFKYIYRCLNRWRLFGIARFLEKIAQRLGLA